MEWEEEAYLQGATHVLTKPVRIRMLTALLDRLWAALPPAVAPARSAWRGVRPKPLRPAEAAAQPGLGQSLGALRGFSAILTHSLDAEGMLKQFLLLLREIHRHQPRGDFSAPARRTGFGGASRSAESRRLRAACAIGLSPGSARTF